MRYPKIRFMTRTALMLALLVALQALTAGAGQYVTGSCVNAVLAVAALVGGIACGAVVATLSPFCAFLLGIGPQLIGIVPGIALGNLTFVALLYLLMGRRQVPVWRRALALVAAAAAKFAMLYVVINKCIVPLLGDRVKPAQASKFLAMFSWPQLVTALIGGAVALAVTPLLKRAVKQ